MKSLFCFEPFVRLRLNSINYTSCCQLIDPKTSAHPSVGRFPNPPDFNNDKFKEIRETILDGSYTYCQECPYLKTALRTNKFSLVKPRELFIKPWQIQVMKGGSLAVDPSSVPLVMAFNYDKSCSLHCTFCREKVFFVKSNTPKYQQLIDYQSILVKEWLPKIKTGIFCGDGDPFTGITYKILSETPPEVCREDFEIVILTNGVFLKRKWEAMTLKRFVKKVKISIDAATEDTYVKTRRGGNFQQVLESAQFVSELGIPLSLNFVLSDDNWQETISFIKLAKSLNATTYIQGIRGCPEKAIWQESHPNHEKFMDYLKDPIFLDKKTVFQQSYLIRKAHNEC